MEYGISLGSNLGDRLAILSEVKRRIAALPRTSVVAASPVYETEPVEVAKPFEHMTFLNASIVVESDLGAERLHAECHAIEKEMGRTRGADRNAPRPVDIDLVYADGLDLAAAELTLPHPRWASRRFVVQPLADIRPDLVITAGGPTVRAVLLSLPEKPDVILFARTW